jgi:hypothetical protein
MGPIPRPEESYRLWCVSEYDQVKIKQPRHLLRVGRRGQDCETKRNKMKRNFTWIVVGILCIQDNKAKIFHFSKQKILTAAFDYYLLRG